MLVQVSYAIGVARPINIYVNTYGRSNVKLSDGEIAPTLEPMSDANADRSLIASVRRVFADLKDGFSYTWRRADRKSVV